MDQHLTDGYRKRAQLIARSLLIGAVSIPLILKLVPPNILYGFRIPETLASRDVWYAANAFAGWTLLGASVVSIALQAALPPATKVWQLWAAFLLPLAGALALSMEYVRRLG